MQDYTIIETCNMSSDGEYKILCLVEYPNHHLGLIWIEGFECSRVEDSTSI